MGPLPGTEYQAMATRPTYEQYRQAQARYPGVVLLFRVGDFCEACDESARVLSRRLGIGVTARDGTVSMNGFPADRLQAYLAKLLRCGERVALCEPVQG